MARVNGNGVDALDWFVDNIGELAETTVKVDQIVREKITADDVEVLFADEIAEDGLFDYEEE